MVGARWSVVSAFPIAGLMALVFRFPVPFVGYVSGFKAILPAMLAIVLYGVFLGGLILVGAIGAIGGALTASNSNRSQQSQILAARLVAMAVTTLCLFVLAILDKIIGPW